MNSFGLRLATAASSPCTPRAAARRGARVSWRSVHTRRELPYKIEGGMGDFLPPPALRTIAEWQDGLLARLNEEVKGSEHENQSVVQTVISTAGDRTKTLAFNYASQALNNSFFLDRLKPPPAPPSEVTDHEAYIGGTLGENICHDFGSVAQMKSTFCATASGMSGSGWVWLVADRKHNLGVLPTFGAGTLLVRSQQRTGGELLVFGEVAREARRAAATPPSGPTSPASGAPGVLPRANPGTPTRLLHASAPAGRSSAVPGVFDSAARAPSNNPSSNDDLRLGEHLWPLLCVSVHEHAWMSAGYGVWGKDEYLTRFWSAVDWMKVSQDYDNRMSKTFSFRK